MIIDKRIIVVTVIVLAVAFVVFSRRLEQTKHADIGDLNVFMAKNAEEAVDIAKGQNISLDYSPSSLKRVDDSLEKIREEYLARKSDNEVLGLSLYYGAYVGEVLRRGDPKMFWKKDHPEIGENSFPLFSGKGDDCVFPVAWCHKRILNGAEDSIMAKVQVLHSMRSSNAGSK